jgi:hypothetical protein
MPENQIRFAYFGDSMVEGIHLRNLPLSSSTISGIGGIGFIRFPAKNSYFRGTWSIFFRFWQKFTLLTAKPDGAY